MKGYQPHCHEEREEEARNSEHLREKEAHDDATDDIDYQCLRGHLCVVVVHHEYLS